jgi:acetyl esterase/lipase
MNAGRFVLAVLLTGVAGLLAFAPAQDNKPEAAPAIQPPAAEPLAVTKTANNAYRDDKDADPERHRLDVYAPKDRKGFPVLFFVHGGTWKSGSKNLYAALGNTFARTGIGVVIINYRLSPKVKHPAHIEDVARAFAWTREHIHKYGGDPANLFVFGHSAGGHLVSLLATDPTYLKAEKRSPADIRGVVSVSGVYEIYHDYKLFHPIFGQDQKVCERASPLWNVTGNHPPFLIAYADDDYEHLDGMALDMQCALARCKCPVTLLKVKDRSHITIIVRVIGDDDPLRRAILDFVGKNGK